MRIIGLTGKKGVGKTYVASLIGLIAVEKSNARTELFNFADPIKEFLVATLGIDRELVYGDDRAKNTPTNYRWDDMPAWLVAKFVVNGRRPSGFLTIRHVAQIFGTELNRDIWSPTIWIDAMKRRLDARCGIVDYVVIADARYQNEIDAIHSWGGQVWKIDGPQRGDNSTKNDIHASETAMDRTIGMDHVLMNGPEDSHAEMKAKIGRILDL